MYLALLLMLLVKMVEGFVRMFGSIGFDRSKHVVDSGLLGACGLLGCCGPRKKRRSRSHPRAHKRQETQTPPRDSDLSSNLPPAGGTFNNKGTVTPPGFPNSESRKGSGNSHPPSVLKPEHANRPYKELVVDNDDNGYIMGAWRPSSRPSTGYIPVSDGPQVPSNFVLQLPQKQKQKQQPSSSPDSTATPGFSRIGGGRAHIDTPYAIATGSTHTFPSIGQQSQRQSSLDQTNPPTANQPLLYEQDMEDNDDLPLSLANVESGTAHGNNGLPAGTTQAAHIRTKSQSAIIENYLPAGSGSGPSLAKQYQSLQPSVKRKHPSQDNFLRPPEEISPVNKFMFGDPDDDSGDEQDQQKKKKPWYRLRGRRLHSTEERPSTSASITDLGDREGVGEMGGLVPSDPKQQRSFVVIRKPASSMGRLNQPSSSASATYPMDNSRPPTR